MKDSKKWGTGKIILITVIAFAVLIVTGYLFGEKPSDSSGTSTDQVSEGSNYTK